MRAICVGFLLLNSACATIFTGSSQTLQLNSEPEGATVMIGSQSCTTPCELSVPKGQEQNVKFKKDGEARSLVAHRSFAPVSLLNLLILPGFIVDAATGAMWDVTPQAMSVDFVRKPASVEP